ncbi:DNA methyltransferase [Microbacterium paraoxydans]|uniref:DNA methyltransferase n=1 Tax=Microbacterium paraoxydans TaxID=199592 RepID=UPI003D72496D
MTLHYEDAGLRLFHGSNRDILPTLPDASYDSIVTDPPYELGFMGKGWDSTGIAYDVDVWRECFRVLKPGGHLLSFGGTRTWHRIAVAIEDAGFEIRDSIGWIYGQGFPKSMDVATAVDKLDAAAERRTRALTFTAWMRTHLTAQQINEITGTAMGTHFVTDKQQPSIATADLFDQLRPHLPTVPEEIEQLVADRTVESANWAAREVTGQHDKPAAANAWRANVVGGAVKAAREKRDRAFTPEAQAWEGWGTALKPALEPIIVARKPFKGTVAANLLAHGTSAINVDACRIPFASDADRRESTEKNQHAKFGTKPGQNKVYGDYSQTEMKDYDGTKGRWPTNIVLTHQPAVDPATGEVVGDACVGGCVAGCPVAELGESARFYPAFRYEGKAKDSERPEVDGVEHATVKPLALMQWLVRLVTRANGRVLDLYAGSGTTGEAALLEGFEVDLIELEADHLPLILARVRKPLQPSMFGEWEDAS